MASKIKMVVIYAHPDKRRWQALKVYISGMQSQGLLNVVLWDIGEISAGADREKTLAQWINEAHIILLLFSPDLFIMDTFNSISASLLHRSIQGTVRILPLLLRPVVSWENTPWGRLAVLPDNEKPVTTWRNRREEAYLNIVEGIRRVVGELEPQLLPAQQEKVAYFPVVQEDKQRLPALPGYGYTLLQTLTPHLGPVASVAFSPDGSFLASDSWDGTIILWEMPMVREFKCLKVKGHTSLVYSLAFSPDGKFLASAGADHHIRLWTIPAGQCLRTLDGHTHAVSSVAFSPDGDRLISGSDDHTVAIWSYATGNLLSRFVHSQSVSSVAWTPNGDYVISGGEDVHMWEASSGRSMASFREHNDRIRSVAASPSGQWVASGSADHTIKLWYANASRGLASVLTFQKHRSIVSSVAFQANGAVLASGSHDKTIKLWDVASGEEYGTLAGHMEAVLSVAFHPSLPLLASGSFDKTVKIWGWSECLTEPFGYSKYHGPSLHDSDPVDE